MELAILEIEFRGMAARTRAKSLADNEVALDGLSRDRVEPETEVELL